MSLGEEKKKSPSLPSFSPQKTFLGTETFRQVSSLIQAQWFTCNCWSLISLSALGGGHDMFLGEIQPFPFLQELEDILSLSLLWNLVWKYSIWKWECVPAVWGTLSCTEGKGNWDWESERYWLFIAQRLVGNCDWSMNIFSTSGNLYFHKCCIQKNLVWEYRAKVHDDCTKIDSNSNVSTII